MIVTSTTGGPGNVPEHRPGGPSIASVDVEWTKNYRVRNGNRAFCYSIVWLHLPPPQGPAGRSGLADAGFSYTSAYVDAEDERGDLVELAATDLAAALTAADILAGHQLCSDLAILAANANGDTPPAIEKAQDTWRHRHRDTPRRVVDTRFDADPILSGRSRRLVDVCEELGLDVTQPELLRTSMTALQREWLDTRDAEARERVTVLNLRHSLSTAIVAARIAGLATWHPGLNVNRTLARGLGNTFAWLAGPTFQSLL